MEIRKGERLPMNWGGDSRAEGEYAVNDIGDKSIPEGFEPDRRESISVPGELVRQNRKRMLLHHCSVRIKEMPSESKKSLVLKSSFAKRYREIFLMLCAYMDGVGLSDEDAEDVLDHLMNDDE